MEKLLSLKDRVDSAASRLLDLFTPNWRNFPQHKLEEGSLQLESSRIHRALEEFIDFGRRSLATAALNGCKKSTAFISRKLQPIEEDLKILDEMETKLTKGKWDIQVLVDENKREGIPDDFDSFVMTTRASPDDVAELASYIYTHSQVCSYPSKDFPKILATQKTNILEHFSTQKFIFEFQFIYAFEIAFRTIKTR